MADSTESMTCFKCSKPTASSETFSFAGNPLCRECFFENSELGPMASQYKKCPQCGTTVHEFTIRCPQCHMPIHETGTIRIQKPIRSSVIMAYGIIALVVVVMAFTIPGFSTKGILAWLSAIFGMVVLLHGLLGVMFRFWPLGFKMLNGASAFLGGFAEAILGFYLLLWPKL